MTAREVKITPQQLRKECDPALFEFETTESLSQLEGILGQERAVRATEFGLRVKKHGYNIFMTGLTGTGKTSYACSVVKKVAEQQPVPDDWCYLYNFKNPDEPLAVNLSAGRGKEFARDIDSLIDDVKEEISKAFNTEDYEQQKGEALKKFQETKTSLMEELHSVAKENGFVLKRTSTGFMSVPIKEGREISEEEYGQLEQDEREEMEKKSTDIQLKAMEVMRRVQNEEKNLKSYLEELDYEIGLNAISHLFEDLKGKYADFPKVISYLEALQEDILENMDDFRDDGDEESKQQASLFWFKDQLKDSRQEKYTVNLLIDHSETKGAPVVVESNPTYYNLIGRVEHESKMGMMKTDFTMIKGGAFHRANGGYLILQVKDLLLNFQSWEVLKRVLKTGKVSIETIGEQYALMTMASLKPESIPLDVKVVLIGTPFLYHLLYRFDEDFHKLFKIKADFDVVMERTRDNMSQMANFVSTYCHREELRHFDRSGLARLVEYSSRLADHQEKLTTRFNEIVEVLCEADVWAEMEEEDLVNARHVDRAIEEKIMRSDKYENKLLELVEEGQILLDLEGEKLGQVNGLSIIDMGEYAFGRPSRITASAFLGRRGIVNIERESEMSGSVHDKGVLIIGGYLGEKYARNFPLALTANLCFEQSYWGVEGDSASSAELYALLSNLSGIPLKQYIGVTGSINQKGEVQPVGGINSKIEGFYASCKQKGLTGEQGVIIPRQNLVNLMLKEEVVSAVNEGRFHIYAVENVDEGLEILTGMEAGAPAEDGSYPEGTVHHLVQQELKRYNDLLKGGESGGGPHDDAAL